MKREVNKKGIFCIISGINSNRVYFLLGEDDMTHILKLCYEIAKMAIIFILCTVLFYYVLKALDHEYQNLDRYDAPQGKAMKVSSSQENDIIDRIGIFFRLGE